MRRTLDPPARAEQPTPREQQWRGSGRTHHGILYVAYRSYPQDRSFVGAIVDAITGMRTAKTLPPPGAEAFLRRVS